VRAVGSERSLRKIGSQRRQEEIGGEDVDRRQARVRQRVNQPEGDGSSWVEEARVNRSDGLVGAAVREAHRETKVAVARLAEADLVARDHLAVDEADNEGEERLTGDNAAHAHPVKRRHRTQERSNLDAFDKADNGGKQRAAHLRTHVLERLGGREVSEEEARPVTAGLKWAPDV